MQKMVTKILFRCNAGEKYGFGHLTRCLALSETFEGGNIQTFFLIKTDEKSTISNFLTMEGIRPSKYIIIPDDTTNSNDLSKIVEIYKNGYSFLVIDHYDHDLIYQESLKEEKIKWAQFDYKANEKILANMVINGNISANKEMYKNIISQNTLQCVGYQFAILRKSFLNQFAIPQKNRILIALGGGLYPAELINMVKLITDQQLFDFEIITNDIRLQKLFNNCPNVRVYINTNNVIPIYKKCECAIVAGGVTTYEVAALNIPMLIIPYVENQIGNAIAWDRNNFAISFKDPLHFEEILNKFGLANLINKLFKKFEKKTIQIDGLGATRIKNIIIKTITQNEK